MGWEEYSSKQLKDMQSELKRYMEAGDHSYLELALHLGVTKEKATAIIQGECELDKSTLLKICKYFKEEPEFFLKYKTIRGRCVCNQFKCGNYNPSRPNCCDAYRWCLPIYECEAKITAEMKGTIRRIGFLKIRYETGRINKRRYEKELELEIEKWNEQIEFLEMEVACGVM